MSANSRSVQDDDGAIPFTVIRRRSRKHLAIVVLETGVVEVRAPVFVTDERIDQFVRSNLHTVRDRLDTVREKAPAATRYETGDTVLYQGRNTPLQIAEEPGAQPGAELRDGHLRVTVPSGLDEDSRHRAIRECILRRLGSRTLELVNAAIDEAVQRVGAQPARITIKHMRSRWGSCSSRGNMSINARLAMAPPEVFEYVLLHELCHLQHPDHSPRFWARMGELMPGYEAPRAWLKRNHLQLSI